MGLLPFGLYRVHGESMKPRLKPGDRVIGWRWRLKPKPKQILVVKNKNDRLIIKRLKKIDPNGLWLEGDNQTASTDSRKLGYYNSHDLEAIVIWPQLPR